jgi:hypothetical protein
MGFLYLKARTGGTMILAFKRKVIFSAVLLLVAGTSVAFAGTGSSSSTINSDKSVSTISTAANGDITRMETETDGTVTTINPDQKIVIRSNDASISTYSAPDKSGVIIYTFQAADSAIQSYPQNPGSFYVPNGIVDDVFGFPGLSPYLDKAASFTVQKDQGNVAVCSMTYRGVTLKGAPWKFTVDPTLPMGDAVQIHYCYGAGVSVDINSQVAFGVDKTFFNGDTNVNASSTDYHATKDRSINITNNSPENVTATLTDSSGKIVVARNYSAETTRPTNDVLPFTIEAAKTPLDKYRLTISSKSYAMSWLILVTSGWAVLDTNEMNPFKPCSTLIWIYLSKADKTLGTTNSPRTASDASVLADISGALSMISSKTSLKFMYSSDISLNGKPNVITYDWKQLGSVAGLGGPSYNLKGAIPSIDDYAVSAGHVSVNPSNSWGANDLFKGAGNIKTPSIIRANKILHSANGGRQWLYAHETMHVLGLDHSIDPHSVMYFVGGDSRFTTADNFGLNFLYPACTN